MLDYAIENTSSFKIGISCSLGYLYSIIVLLDYNIKYKNDFKKKKINR